MAQIRVLVADDSAVIRRLISDVINAEPDMEVVGVASDGAMAVEQARALNPDAITLDVEMPVKDGFGALAEIRKFAPATPVIMFSTLLTAGADLTADAIARGANAVMAKPTGTGGLTNSLGAIRTDLVPQLRKFAERRLARTSAIPTRPTLSPRVDCVAFAVSTGGPRALEDVVPFLPPDLGVPMVMVQHMPATFTQMLATRLGRRSNARIVEAEDGMPVQSGTLYIAPGSRHLTVRRESTAVVCRLTDDPPEHSCRPSADVLFRSVAQVYGKHGLGVVLTGMGEDGIHGSRAIVAAGGRVIVQDEKTSTVWGMPGAVARAGLADAVLPLSDIVPEIIKRVGAARSLSPRAGARGGPGV